jgi:hypothetical protein
MGTVPVGLIAGNWQLALSDGHYIELALLQSGSAIFGKGRIASCMESQGAFASGSVSGSNLQLDVIPESGTEFYTISIDITRLPFEGTYVVFSADSAPQTGTLSATKYASYG